MLVTSLKSRVQPNHISVSGRLLAGPALRFLLSARPYESSHKRVSISPKLLGSTGVIALRHSARPTSQPLSFCNKLRGRQVSVQAEGSTYGDEGGKARSVRKLPERILDSLYKLTKVLLCGFTLAVVFISLLPALLSTAPGLRAGSAVASRFVPGILHVEEAELGWRKPISLKAVTLRTPETLGKETLASVPCIRTTSSLFDVVMGRGFDIFAQQPWIDCSLAPSGKLKWSQLIDYEAGKAQLSTQSNGPPSVSQGKVLQTQEAGVVVDTSDIPFTAEGRILAGSLYISDGTLRVPQEVKEVVGQDVHIIALSGSKNLQESADELSVSTDWLDQASASLPGQPAGQRGGRIKHEPFTGVIRSQHLDFEISGWHRPDGSLQLRQPASGQLQFTPALAKYGLARVSPLLSGVLAVGEGIVKLEVSTQHLQMPAENYHIRIDPLRVAVNRQDLLAKFIEFLRLQEAREVGTKSLLQGAVSAIHLDISEKGSLKTQRLDLLLTASSKGKGVHLCTWGEVDPVNGAINIALGVPPDTLSQVGLRHVDNSKMLVIPVRGSSGKPSVNWAEAYKNMASLAASTKGQPTSLRGQILQGIVQGLDLRANAPGLATSQEFPQPLEELPWEDDKSLFQDTVHVDDSAKQVAQET